jgi:SAM-dependent methyltransferase
LTEWYKNRNFWRDLEPFLFSTSHWDRAPREVEQGLSLLGLPEGAEILDIPCGPGRHALEFARRGCRVTAVDLMPFYIDKAREQARSEGLEIEFVQADMLSFTKPEAFDVAWNFFSSFGYFDDPGDDQVVLYNIYRSLKPGGRLLLETIDYEYLRGLWSDREPIRLPTVDGITVTVEGPMSDIDSPSVKWCVEKGGTTSEFELVHRHYSPDSISYLLKKAGFTKVEFFQDVSGAPFTPESERMVVIAEKCG